MLECWAVTNTTPLTPAELERPEDAFAIGACILAGNEKRAGEVESELVAVTVERSLDGSFRDEEGAGPSPFPSTCTATDDSIGSGAL